MKKINFKSLKVQFLVLISLVIIGVLTKGYLTRSHIKKNTNLLYENILIYSPSYSLLNELNNDLLHSKMLIKNWVFIEKTDNTPDKIRLKKLINNDIPEKFEKLYNLAEKWDKKDAILLKKINKTIIDSLFPKYHYIMKSLDSFDKYNDPMVLFEITPMVQHGGELITLIDKIDKTIKELSLKYKTHLIDSNDKVITSMDNFEKSEILTNILLIITIFIISIFLIRIFFRPLNEIIQIINEIGKGKLPENLLEKKDNEIGQIYKAVNNLINGLKNAVEFALDIGKGKLEKEYKILSEDDKLGIALLEMRENLKKAKEQELKHKEKEAQRQWITEGLAKFSEILRTYNNDIQKLNDEIIKNLVKYVDAQLGAIYIVNEDKENNKYLETIAVYAYDRKKYLKKEIVFGEGLVGTCAIEKLPIYLTDISEDYIKIRSGLGQSNPKSVFLVPMKVEEEIFGVIELASLYEMEPHKREFVEKLSESIAVSLNSIKMNIKTSELLQQAQEQAEILKTQEEEMRQNLEELQATQEEAYRRELELQNIINIIDKTFIRFEVNKNRKIIFANNKTKEILLYTKEEIIGKDFASLLTSEQQDDFNKLWEEVLAGIYKGRIYNILDKNKMGIESYLIFSSVFDENKKVEKVIVIQNILI